MFIFLIVYTHCVFLSALKKKSSVVSLDPEGLNVEVGDQVLVAGQKNGTVRFYGKTDFAPGGSSVHPALHLIYLHGVSPPSTHRCADLEKVVKRTLQHCELSVRLQVTGLASSWTSPRGNTTALCLECATSVACPNTECLHHLPVSRGVCDSFLLLVRRRLAVLLLYV